MASERIVSGELLAGTAAATFLVLATALGVTPWLSVPFAIGSYLTVGLAWRKAGRRVTRSDARRGERAYKAAVANIAAIRELMPGITDPAVREQIGGILIRFDRVLKVIDEDKNLAATPLFNDRLVQPLLSFLTDYVRLAARNVKSARDLLAKAESHDLPMFERAIDDFFEKLHRGHVVDLATLSEILEFNLESLETTTLRRTPS